MLRLLLTAKGVPEEPWASRHRPHHDKSGLSELLLTYEILVDAPLLGVGPSRFRDIRL